MKSIKNLKISNDSNTSSSSGGGSDIPSPRIVVDNLSPKSDNENSSIKRSTSPLSFLQSLSPKNRKKSTKKSFSNDIDSNPLSLNETSNNSNSFYSNNELLPIRFLNDSPPYKSRQFQHQTNTPIIINNINQLPHRILIKILNNLIIDKFDKEKMEIRKSKLPMVYEKSSSSSKKKDSTLQSPSSSDDDVFNKNNNFELESICMVCKLWGMEIAPQVFNYFIVRSPKQVKSLIRLVTVGLLPSGSKKFEFEYISMVIDKSSNYQKFMNIIKHRMPDKLPDKFLKATTKPILSNLFSKHLFSAFFENCKSVQYFRFYQRWISPDNFSFIGQSLRGNTNISHISFKNNNLEDGFLSDLIQSLYENQTITYLDLSGNKLGYETALGLAGALTKNRTLETIDLFFNNINSSGGVALGKALKMNNTLKNLYLRWNRIKTPGALAMAEALQVNTSIVMISMDRIEDSGGEALFHSLQSNSSVLNIDLSDCVFQQKTLLSLSNALGAPNSLCSISNLNLKSNQLGNGQLEGLSLALSKNQTITKLNLSDNRISDEEGYLLANSLTQNRSIESLLLSLNNLSNKFSEHLAAALRVNETLHLLDISANQITLNGGKLIGESLVHNNALKLLNLNQNPLSPEFGQIISECMKNNQTLEHLELAYTGLHSKGALPLAKLLANDQSKLKKLNLSENSLNDQIGIEFANSLTSNTFITDLDLSLNNLSSRSKEHFEKSKSKNLSLINYSISSIPLKWKFQI